MHIARSPVSGKKLELVARIQDWVHEPEILARLEEQRLLELQQDAILGQWMCTRQQQHLLTFDVV